MTQRILNEEEYLSIKCAVNISGAEELKSFISYIKDAENEYYKKALKVFNGDKFDLICFIKDNSYSQKFAVGTGKFVTEGSFKIEVDNEITDIEDVDVFEYIYEEDDFDSIESKEIETCDVEEFVTELCMYEYDFYVKRNSLKKSA